MQRGGSVDSQHISLNCIGAWGNRCKDNNNNNNINTNNSSSWTYNNEQQN